MLRSCPSKRCQTLLPLSLPRDSFCVAHTVFFRSTVSSPAIYSVPVMSTPSSLQMTLAMALVKSKPADTTIRAYLVQLRADIQSTRGPQIGEARERHLDNVAYWKTKYEAAESKCIELQHRIVQLERERDMLEHQAGNQNTSAASSTTRKRGTSKQQAAAPKTSKKMKTSKARAPDPHELDPNDTISDDLSFLDGLGKGMSPTF